MVLESSVHVEANVGEDNTTSSSRGDERDTSSSEGTLAGSSCDHIVRFTCLNVCEWVKFT